MNIVIDTNVITSALFFGGKPDKLIDLLLTEKLHTFVSPEIIAEYQEIFARMIKKYDVRKKSTTLADILSQCTSVSPTRKIAVCRDPDDDKFIRPVRKPMFSPGLYEFFQAKALQKLSFIWNVFGKR